MLTRHELKTRVRIENARTLIRAGFVAPHWAAWRRNYDSFLHVRFAKAGGGRIDFFATARVVAFLRNMEFVPGAYGRNCFGRFRAKSGGSWGNLRGGRKRWGGKGATGAAFAPFLPLLFLPPFILFFAVLHNAPGDFQGSPEIPKPSKLFRGIGGIRNVLGILRNSWKGDGYGQEET